MRTIKIPVQNASQGTRLSRMRIDAGEALQDFCHQKLLATKLVGPTFSYRFNLCPGINSSTMRSEIKKGLVRLKELFRRDLEKSIPYTEYAREPLLNIKNRQTYQICLMSWAEKSAVNHRQFQSLSGAARRALVRESAYGRVIERYVRYLQFLCLKYGAPFLLKIDTDLKYSDASNIEVQGIYSEEQAANYYPELHYVCKINIDPVYFTPIAIGNLRTTNSTTLRSIPEWINTVLKNGLKEDAVYTVDQWVGYPIANGRPVSTTDITGLGKYWIAERMFLFIDEIRQVLKSLSRKTSYVPSAFSIRTSENT
jgi:hypothetical protein